MCHSWMKRIYRWDHKKQFMYAPLEGNTARQMLAELFPNYLKENTVIYFEDGKVYTRSTAALKIIQRLGQPYTLIGAGWIVPRFIRDGVYRMIANRRYRYGQRYESCPLPPIEWRQRFLP